MMNLFECSVIYEDLNGQRFCKEYTEQFDSVEDAVDTIMSWPYTVIEYTVEAVE
jgi:hypothetical protein